MKQKKPVAIFPRPKDKKPADASLQASQILYALTVLQKSVHILEHHVQDNACQFIKSLHELKETIMSEITDFSDKAEENIAGIQTSLTALTTSLTNIAQDITDIKNSSTGISQADKDRLAGVSTNLTTVAEGLKTLAQVAADLDNQNPATPPIPPVEPV